MLACVWYTELYGPKADIVGQVLGPRLCVGVFMLAFMWYT